MSRASALLTCLLILLASGIGAAEVVTRSADRALRYVNDEVITLGDILARTQERMAQAQARNLPIPRTPEELDVFNRATLEELTDESLLVQAARQFEHDRGIHLVDRDQISQEVLERAHDLGQPMTLKELAWQRKLVERTRSMDAILGIMDVRTAQVSPATLHAVYERRAADFRRPPAVRALQILLRPTAPEELAAVAKERVDLLKLAGACADAQIKQLAGERITAYVANDITPDAQEALLKRFIGELAATDARTDLDPEGLTLAKRARALLAREAGQRDKAATVATLEQVRTELLATIDATAREAAFRLHATSISQGPNPDHGGELGWIEPGTFTPAFDEQVFAVTAGQLTPVFWTKDAACLVLVAERKESRLRPFAEVAGDLEEELRRDRRKSVRERTLATLRAQASIRDLAPPTMEAP